MQFNDKYRFKWVQTPAEVNYMKFVEGRHICNHFSNANVLTRKLSTLEQIQSLNLSMRSRSSEISKLFESVNQFVPETYRLDVVADLVQFLNQKDEGLWMVKHSNSNQGKGVEMVQNISKFKQDLVNKKDKWADQQINENVGTAQIVDEQEFK